MGKLTIAKELAKLTDFKLLHNHLSVDLVTSLFQRSTAPYFSLLRNVRFAMIEAAVIADIPGIITTFVFSPNHHKVAAQYAKEVRRLGGDIFFVRLYCEREILAQRVKQEDRKAFDKIDNETVLNKKLDELGDPFATILDKNNLDLNTGEHSPSEAAKSIMKHYHLSGSIS